MSVYDATKYTIQTNPVLPELLVAFGE
jgi:hypothetical protein